MSFLGLTVRANASRPHVRGVLLEHDGAIRKFQHHAPASETLAGQIAGVVDAVRSEIAGDVDIEAVVLREADDGRHGGLTTGRKARARAEGAVLAVARSVTPNVEVMNGPQLGRALEGKLADAQDAGRALVGSAEWVEPAAAALAARAIVMSADS